MTCDLNLLSRSIHQFPLCSHGNSRWCQDMLAFTLFAGLSRCLKINEQILKEHIEKLRFKNVLRGHWPPGHHQCCSFWIRLNGVSSWLDNLQDEVAIFAEWWQNLMFSQSFTPWGRDDCNEVISEMLFDHSAVQQVRVKSFVAVGLVLLYTGMSLAHTLLTSQMYLENIHNLALKNTKQKLFTLGLEKQ